jgi:hypothetical protein
MSDNKGTPPKPQQPKPQPQQPSPLKRINEGTIPVTIPIKPPEKK